VLIAIDPSVNYIGVAVFSGKELITADLINLVKHKSLGDKLAVFIERLNSIVDDKGSEDDVTFIFEHPSFYYHDKSKKGIMKLWHFIGALESLCVIQGMAVESVEVCDWKGRTSKDITELTVRAMYRAGWETVRNNVAVSYRHNVYDAIALGDWRIKNGTLEPGV